MACLKVTGPYGPRLIAESPDGNVHGVRPGETIVGSEMACGPQAIGIQYDFDSLITPEGLMIGNVIKKVTTALGISHCLACHQRQQRYNQKGLEIQQHIKDLF